MLSESRRFQNTVRVHSDLWSNFESQVREYWNPDGGNLQPAVRGSSECFNVCAHTSAPILGK